MWFDVFSNFSKILKNDFVIIGWIWSAKLLLFTQYLKYYLQTRFWFFWPVGILISHFLNFFFLLPGTKFNFLGGGGVCDFYHSCAYALVGWVKISLKSISQQMLWSANFSEISLKIVMLSHLNCETVKICKGQNFQ